MKKAILGAVLLATAAVSVPAVAGGKGYNSGQATSHGACENTSRWRLLWFFGC